VDRAVKLVISHFIAYRHVGVKLWRFVDKDEPRMKLAKLWNSDIGPSCIDEIYFDNADAAHMLCSLLVIEETADKLNHEGCLIKVGHAISGISSANKSVGCKLFDKEDLTRRLIKTESIQDTTSFIGSVYSGDPDRRTK
jgi:hypothetical protein